MAHPIIENETPFAFDYMGLSDEEGRPLLLLLAKATYTLDTQGLTLAELQVPVKWGGEPWGEPGRSSDRCEPECAFFKPATDVVLVGHAHAPRKGTTEVLVSLRAGPVQKVIRVVGERTWFRGLGRISMTKPLPFETLPLTWERAFGGWDRSAPEPERHAFEPRNPVGTGFRASPRNFEEGLKLPNLEDPETPLREFGQRVAPVGFGFTSPHWQPRAALAGTYDAEWERTRKPLLPADFQRRYFNAAAPGLVAPAYLRGDEPVSLSHASSQGPLTFSLPGQRPPRATVELTLTEDVEPELRLDTLILDTDASRVMMLWRGHVLLGEEGLHEVVTVRLVV